jgi:hypothetical protein
VTLEPQPWLGRVHMKGGASQVELDQPFGIYCSLRDGKVVRARAFPSWEQALEAGGAQSVRGQAFHECIRAG